ncbi:MAG: CaiB/BaiF CoA-transferase family protein [Pseudomonadota bacterium]
MSEQSDTAPPPRPLEGILVVALEQAVAAPLATCRLADAGARVIKIERPEGDFARGYDRAFGEVSSYFAWLNRGKESIALDLKNPEDVALLYRMIARADVVVQNFAVGTATRLGFGSADLRKRHPRLITCDISGYGETGPYADMKAYDLLIQAESGLVSVNGAPGPMGRVGVSVADIACGTNAALGITEALLRREKTGAGDALAVSLFDAMAEWMAVPLAHFEQLGRAPERVGLAHPSIAPYGAFACRDGIQLLISIQSDREWRALCGDVLGRPELANDVRFATNTARVENRADTDRAVADHFARVDSDRLAEALKSARIAFGRVNDCAGLSQHPHLRRETVATPSGTAALPAPPIRRGSVECAGPNAQVPALDQHGTALRQEFATV